MNNTALAIIQSDELDTIQRAARLLAVSNYFDGKGDNPLAIAQLAAKIMAGREMGFGPFASANGIHIIQGKPAVGANLMATAVKSSGRYTYKVLELTNTVCRIEFFERIADKWESVGVSEFTKADATAAKTKNMDAYPKNMLFARALSNGVRWYTPDVFSGNAVYVPEEMGAEVDGDGNVINTTYVVSKPAIDEPRVVEPSTGEILEPANPFDDPTPYYVHAHHRLTGKEYDLVEWVAKLHDKSDGPCTRKQYGYLTGITDKLTNGEHGYILSVLCQAEISKSNLPGVKVATNLLDLIQPTIKLEVEGVETEVANAKYRPDIAEMLTRIAAASLVAA